MRHLFCLIAILLSAGQPPVLRVSTRLVEVSVVVHDSHGEPVSDLKKEDFTITERGKPQPISFFSMVSADRSAVPSATLPPHIFSNVFTERQVCRPASLSCFSIF